jgi:hypothetical protein
MEALVDKRRSTGHRERWRRLWLLHGLSLPRLTRDAFGDAFFEGVEMPIPGALVQAVSDRTAVLFAGAGMSVTAVQAAASDLREAHLSRKTSNRPSATL